MSLSARARTLTDKELVNLYELATPEEQKELAQALYERLARYVHGSGVQTQTKLL